MRVSIIGWLLFILTTAGCFQPFDGGVGPLIDWTADVMTLSGQNERVAEFRHPDPYWIAFVPPKTPVEQIATTTAVHFEDALRSCLAEPLPHIVVADSNGLECLPYTRAEIPTVMARTKRHGESTTITVSRVGGAYVISRVS